MQSLNDKISHLISAGLLPPEAPESILSNLKKGYGQRSYQVEAFARFVYYINHEKSKNKPTQLLFHMATGSGKTLVMAGCILYLYLKGYRNFIFFVNSSNIIEKTKNNFLNSNTSKYLFNDIISFGDKQVRIKEVENFQAANQDDINIVFSTIQGLHTRLNTPRENQITYDDFAEQNIVLISDEAHHINTETKKGEKLSKEEAQEILTWEGTVNKIFKANPENILLEFTATADLFNPEIGKKYFDKLLFDYPLRQFRADGYSKEVKVLQADLPEIDRALQGVILSQYRRKVFEKHRQIIKPVILFKSRTIKESHLFYEQFVSTIKKLSASSLEKIKNTTDSEIIKKAFSYFENNRITLDNLAEELKNDFSEEKCIAVNSKEESDEKQIAVNTLEDENNLYRAIFAVDKLNEGWDVLNLFDIVRLYDTRDAKQGKPGKTTMSEAQLIGRGARYCPFQFDNGQSVYTRKFDTDLAHEMRICEELYYHSAYNPRYIEELNTALEDIGLKPKTSKEIEVRLKDSFLQSHFYQSGFIFINQREKYDFSDAPGLASILKSNLFHVTLKTGYTQTSLAFNKQEYSTAQTIKKLYPFISMGMPVIRKALNVPEFYRFDYLKLYFPQLSSVSEFINSDKYLGNLQIEVEGMPEQVGNLSPQERLETVLDVLQKIAAMISSQQPAYRGTQAFRYHPLKDVIKNKKLTVTLSEDNDNAQPLESFNKDVVPDLATQDWFVFREYYGTAAERYLLRLICEIYDKLTTRFENIYLVKNEGYFSIYNFDDGKPLTPSFVLYFTSKNDNTNFHYQIFIDCNEQITLPTDLWKVNLFNTINTAYSFEQAIGNSQYIIGGICMGADTYTSTALEKDLNRFSER